MSATHDGIMRPTASQRWSLNSVLSKHARRALITLRT